MSATFHEINVSPFATNALDLVGRTDLTTSSGDPVRVERFTSFRVFVAGALRITTDDNLAVSAFLNRLPIGVTA